MSGLRCYDMRSAVQPKRAHYVHGLYHIGHDFDCVVSQPWFDWTADEAGDSHLVKLLKVCPSPVVVCAQELQSISGNIPLVRGKA